MTPQRTVEGRGRESGAAPEATAEPRIAVDARMLGSSGIGTYIREAVPRVLGLGTGLPAASLGDPAALERCGFLSVDGARAVRCDAPIYSIREQVELARRAPSSSELFWSPHYNIPLAWRGKLIVTVHDAFHLARIGELPGLHRRAYARLMFAALARRADLVLCDSSFTADELLRLTAVPADRLRVVHLGVAAEWYDGVASERPHPRPYIVFVGNIKPHKNLLRLVRAFASVADRLPHDLLIVGRREGFIVADAEVAREAARLGERVRFTGELEQAELREIVASASLLALPSTYEGFGLPPLEAMAAGTPVLVSRAGSLPEVCGEAALYCDSADTGDIAEKLLRLATDVALRAELAERGSEHARAFTWERCAEETRAVLDELLE